MFLVGDVSELWLFPVYLHLCYSYVQGPCAALNAPEEDHGAAGAPQGLVGRGGDHVRVLKGRRNDARGDLTASEPDGYVYMYTVYV